MAAAENSDADQCFPPGNAWTIAGPKILTASLKMTDPLSKKVSVSTDPLSKKVSVSTNDKLILECLKQTL
jgi:hypothetical protein